MLSSIDTNDSGTTSETVLDYSSVSPQCGVSNRSGFLTGILAQSTTSAHDHEKSA